MTGPIGCRLLTIADEGATPRLFVFHPSAGVPTARTVGPYALEAVHDGPVVDGPLPLVLVSHGRGGSPLTHRVLAERLARRGFVVALLEHPGDNRDDGSLTDTVANLERRPRTLRRAVDTLLADPALAPHLRADAVAIVGHSMGGYTALAAAGGRPRCFARESPDGREHAVDVVPDPRVRAVVLLAPATPWYLDPYALRAVRVPILMLTAEHDPFTPAWQGALVLDRVPDPAAVEHRVIAGAGHFSFLSPFPDAMRVPGFLPAQDPPGFDRAHFHERLPEDVATFLSRVMPRVEPAP